MIVSVSFVLYTSSPAQRESHVLSLVSSLVIPVSCALPGSMYADRAHFVSKMLVAVMAWGTAELFRSSGVDHSTFHWYLRPHHAAEDFQPLLRMARRAFDAMGAQHAATCQLQKHMPLVVVDGKWSIQTPVCAERGSGSVWNDVLCTGFLQGCCARPMKGLKFCAAHQRQCSIPPESCGVSAHRERKTLDCVRLEYSVDGVWKTASEVPVGHVRAYESLACAKT